MCTSTAGQRWPEHDKDARDHQDLLAGGVLLDVGAVDVVGDERRDGNALGRAGRGDGHEEHDDHEELTVSDETLATFNNYSQLFEFPKGAGCNLTSFKSGLHSVSTEGDHKDVELSYEFACSNPSQLKSLAINAFDRFSELETLNFEAVINNKALTKSLKSDANKVIF